ncbi:cold shock domain-containing protein [Candidatus Woesearchaeota archaeon]|nr:cold shock domain-containing protein [Candidatus Woesearchaeota archaeon]
MEGSVKFFNRKKGFGFIAGDDGKEYFVHFTGLAKGTFLRDNDRVSFEGGEGDRGLKATEVTLTQKASERSDVAPRAQSSSQSSYDDEEDEDQDA